jgi:hypothetical protein
MHGAAATLKLGDRLAACANHFQRTQYALAVCRTQPVGHQRIKSGEFACSASTPSSSSRERNSSRMGPGMAGMSDRPPVRARK